MYYKEKAVWLPKLNVFVKQIMVSIISYLTLPFYKEKKNAIQRFFIDNYYNTPDGLVFDGTSSGYFDRINLLIDFSLLPDMRFVDLGCGQGSLVFWLQNNKISYQEYLGIDFAIKQSKKENSVVFINDSILNAGRYIRSSDDIIMMCNSLCYITDEEFAIILSSLKKGNRIIIIDPSPNLFWDAHFEGIKPIYRKRKTVLKLLNDSGFIIDSSIQDYLFKMGTIYCMPLSYGIYAIKK